jgi:hypothetical protein
MPRAASAICLPVEGVGFCGTYSGPPTASPGNSGFSPRSRRATALKTTSWPVPAQLLGLSYDGGPLCGFGCFLLFEKQGEGWQELDRYGAWVS